MLRITIDLCPYGDESRRQQLTQFEVVNTGRTSNPDTYIIRKNRESQQLGEFKHYRNNGLNMCASIAFSTLCSAGLDKL